MRLCKLNIVFDNSSLWQTVAWTTARSKTMILMFFIHCLLFPIVCGGFVLGLFCYVVLVALSSLTII